MCTLHCCSMHALLCKEWARVFCRVLALLRDTPALQAVLSLMTRMVTERPRYRQLCEGGGGGRELFKVKYVTLNENP